MVRVHVLLSFVAAFYTGIAHCLPFGDDDFLGPLALEPDLWWGADSHASYPAADTVDFSYHDDLNNPFLAWSDEAPSASQCVGGEYPTESFNKARSLDADQVFDLAGGGFCLQDPSEKEQEAPIELDIPDPTALFNLLPTPDLERETPWRGFWYCAAGDRVVLVCCESIRWDSTRDGCTKCMFHFRKRVRPGFLICSRISGTGADESFFYDEQIMMILGEMYVKIQKISDVV